MTVSRRRSSIDRKTSRWWTRSTSRPSSGGIEPSVRNARCTRDPSLITASIRSGTPWRYQVTKRVHSPTSVGATRWRSIEFTSVDFPALIRPATASRSGSANSRRMVATASRVAPSSSSDSSRPNTDSTESRMLPRVPLTGESVRLGRSRGQPTGQRGEVGAHRRQAGRDRAGTVVGLGRRRRRIERQ